jgi:hypothetical protein
MTTRTLSLLLALLTFFLCGCQTVAQIDWVTQIAKDPKPSPIARLLDKDPPPKPPSTTSPPK